MGTLDTITDSRLQHASSHVGSSSSPHSQYSAAVSRWARKMARKFKRYAPALALLSFTAEQGALSTNQLYQHALEMESSLRAGVQSSYAVANRPSSRRYSFIPYVGDGFVKYVDMNGGGEFKAIRMPNGYWALEATNEMFEMFGGRNKAASILDRLEDGDFFRDISRGSHIQRATRIAA